jgi:hypothetical protein
MAAYMAGALFASTEYNLFPYFMVGYISAVYQIAGVAQGRNNPPRDETRSGDKGKYGNGAKRERELAWSR